MKKYIAKIKNVLSKGDSRIKLGLVIWFSAMWSWTLFTDSLDLAGSHTQGLILAIIITAINVSLSVAIVWQTFKLLRKLFTTKPIWLSLLLALPILALMDFLVAWLVAAIWIGPQGLIDSVLPLSTPTLLIINTPLAYASRLVGFYGLAAFAWLIVFLLLQKRLRMYAIIPLLIVSTLSLIGWHAYKQTDGSEIKIKVISETLTNRVPKIESGDTDVVIFPEYGLDKINNKNLEDRIELKEDAKQTAFLGSEQVNPIDKTGHLNRLIFGNTRDGIVSKQDKYRLIPGGEDLPYTLRVGLRATNQKATLDYFSLAKGVIKGPQQLQNFTINADTELGTAVCSSIISPEDYRHFVNQGATALTNSASLTIFKGSPLFSWQQKSFARFMAISNSRYFMQSANGARAYVLDNNGKTITEGTGIQVLDANVSNNSQKTIYTYLGEWLVLIGAVTALSFLMQYALQRRKAISASGNSKSRKKKAKAKTKRL